MLKLDGVEDSEKPEQIDSPESSEEKHDSESTINSEKFIGDLYNGKVDSPEQKGDVSKDDIPSAEQDPDEFINQIYQRNSESIENDNPKEVENLGGSYKDVKKFSDGENYEVHHMPADSSSPLETNDGPAIRMDKVDHRQTASCGSSKEAREYRAQQKELIDGGQFREALQMDIDDIHNKFDGKYDEAINQALSYADELEKGGKI